MSKLGYEKLHDDFECLYVHALVVSRRQGMAAPLLSLLKEENVVESFHLAWEQRDIVPFSDKARWAVQALREGDDVRALGIDVEQEVRKFYGAFAELVQRARKPAEQEMARQLQQIIEIIEIISKREPVEVEVIPTTAQRFERDLREWLEACGYQVDRKTEWLGDRSFEFNVERLIHRRIFRFLVRGCDGVVGAGELHELPVPGNLGVDETWIVTPVEVTPAARKQAHTQKNGRCTFCFDDLVDEEADFSKYEAALIEEYKRIKIADYYVALRCRKPDVDRKGVVRGESRYKSLEEFVTGWLEQTVREHISVLGEFGTGKTWSCLHMAHERLMACRAARTEGRPRGHYPLLIPLRDFVKAVSLESLLAEFFFNKYEIGLPSLRAFHVLNRMGRFLLIFDGFDEMARKIEYSKVVDNFWELASAVVPGSKAVLTCRDEHFRYEQEAQTVMHGEEKASTEKIVLVAPRFDVVHIEPFSKKQIREAIVKRKGKKKGGAIAGTVLGNETLVDLAQRPVMIDMVMDCLDDIEGKLSVTTSQVYLYATDHQIRRNIKAERTFTSMQDKVLFLCELAWEMHTEEKLKVHYKLFPDRIRAIFGDRVAAEEMDHWWYDLTGQTLLVRDGAGNYTFAHRGLVEFFCAYKLLARAGALGDEFVERYLEKPGEESPAGTMKRDDVADLADSWGAAPFHPNLVSFLAEMASDKDALMRLLDWTKGRDESEVCHLGGNVATVLARMDRAAFKEADLARASLRRAKLAGADLSRVKARGADLRKADLTMADLAAADLRKARLQGATIRGLDCHGTLACDAAGEILFGGPQLGGWVYDLSAGRFLSVCGATHHNWTCDRAVSADGTWLAHAENDTRNIHLGCVDRAGGTIEWNILEAPFDLSAYPGVAWHPEGWFLVVNGKQALRVEAGPPHRISELPDLPFETRGAGIAIKPPLWVISLDKEAIVWHETEWREIARLPAKAFAGERPEFSPSGNHVSIANQTGLFVFEMKTWKQIPLIEGFSERCTHAWSPDAKHVAFRDDPKVLIVNAADFSVAQSIQPPKTAWGAAFHGPDELIVVDSRASIHLCNVHTGELLRSIHQTPMCKDARFRGATGLDDETREALESGGARV